MDEFEILIVDNPDGEDFIAEIWHKDIMICELFEDRTITFYKKDETTYNFDEFLSLINEAEKRLFQK